MAQLNFRGQDIPAFVKVEKIQFSLFPKKTVKTVSIPDRYGVIETGIDYGERVISAQVTILPDSNDNVMEKARILTEWVGTDKGDLILGDEPDKKYTARVSSDVPIEDIIFAGKGKIEFLCADPSAYAIIPSTENISTDAFAVEYFGSIEAFPVFTVTMTAAHSNFKIEATGTGDMVNVIHSFESGDVLVIDCKRKIIKINGQTSMTKLDLNSDWLVLKTGTNNFTKTPSGTDSVQIDFVERWL